MANVKVIHVQFHREKRLLNIGQVCLYFKIM